MGDADMAGWEYRVIPAPTKGQKAKGVKGAEGRFAFALEAVMNQMGRDGWEFQRSETLPSTERSGLTGSTTEWRNVLVFRRPAHAPLDDFEPELLPAPDLVAGDGDGPAMDAEQIEPESAEQLPPEPRSAAINPVAGMTASLKKLAARRGVASSDD